MTVVETAAGEEIPGYELDEAAPLIGMGAVQLRVYLSRHPELAEVRYKTVGRMRIKKRVITPQEVQRIIAERAK